MSDPDIDLRSEDDRSGPSRWRLPACPNCESRRFESVSDGESINFRCLACGRCWHFELNRSRRVDPATCFGCSYRDACGAIYATDHPDHPVEPVSGR